MKVTVAIITKDRADQLKRCLKSLTKQTHKDFKVLVVDNNSTDNTKETVLSFKDKLNIRYVFEPKIGRSNARNRVLREVTGDILVTLDDDCEAFPTLVSNVLKSHHDHPDVLVVVGWAISRPKNNSIGIIGQLIQESAFKENIIAEKGLIYHFGESFLDSISPIFYADAKNSSFKLKELKKMKLLYSVSWKHGEDLEYSKRLLDKGKKILFDPGIKVYHWERPTLPKFIEQRFGAGSEVMRAQLRWPHLFPKRNTFWWSIRFLNLLGFLIRNKYFSKSIKILPLFIIERISTIAGRYTLYFSRNHTQDNSNS